VSIGGQAYGSVTEDYYTAMRLLAAGFSTMYLNERLVFGMVPEDIHGGRGWGWGWRVQAADSSCCCRRRRRCQESAAIPAACKLAFARHAARASTKQLPSNALLPSAAAPPAGVFQQRLRWAMGALQILYRDNPLAQPGLTWQQRWLFFEAAAHHYLAIPTLMFSALPLVYLFLEVGPVTVRGAGWTPGCSAARAQQQLAWRRAGVPVVRIAGRRGSAERQLLLYRAGARPLGVCRCILRGLHVQPADGGWKAGWLWQARQVQVLTCPCPGLLPTRQSTCTWQMHAPHPLLRRSGGRTAVRRAATRNSGAGCRCGSGWRRVISGPSAR
jgi:hypothetical protein